MKSSKGISKKSKTMDYTNYAYNEAVGRLKVMLADNSYVATPKMVSSSSAYLRNFNEDSGDNFSDNLSVIERPVFSDISKYLSPSQKSRISSYRPKKSYTSGYLSASKENLATNPSTLYPSSVPVAPLPTDSVQAPVEIFSFIEKQEDYIEQLEKESKYCRNELTNLLGKVKDVINENEHLTENARSELAALGVGGAGGGGSGASKPMVQTTTSPSSDSDEHLLYAGRKTPSTPRKSTMKVQSPRFASAPNIVYEARISELEAELMQANIDLKRVRTENEELKRKHANTDPLSAVAIMGSVNCETHRKQLELLQQEKGSLEETVRQLQRMLDEAKSLNHNSANNSKRYISDLVQMERSQAELEVRHLRDELDRQHERVRELQHEMARRLADERATAERRYNSQVDQLGGDLSSQWEQVAKLQLELERQKRYETDLKRDVANRNSQIEELKMELRGNRTTFLADMAQASAEKQSLEQEITSLRLQLDRAAREAKTEAARLNAEINSLRQRLDRGDADILHSKREVLRLNDEIANLEKELAYGELKNEIRPTKKDLDKRISEMQDKHEPVCDYAMPTITAITETTTTATATNAPMAIQTMPITTATVAATTATATTSALNENANAYTLLPNLDVAENAAGSDVADDNGDEILQNIIKSNARLAEELAKMPPLPKLTSYKKHRANNYKTETTATTSATPLTATTTSMGARPKCFCPSFMRHKHEHEHTIYTKPAMRQREANTTCCNSSRNNRSSSKQSTAATLARTQTTHGKSMHCHTHEHTLDTHHEQQHHRTAPPTTTPTTTATTTTTCCHPCKTELLPWLQQHLVLNQTISRSANSCQPPCQTSHLTVDAETTATSTTASAATTTCKGRNSNALNASIKPKHYFEQLLQRDGCHKKPRPPVKVDVNVRLVPKQSNKPKVNTLNKTFVKELDEVAHALNETFVKDTTPELSEIDEQLAKLEDVANDDYDEEQEQATKL